MLQIIRTKCVTPMLRLLPVRLARRFARHQDGAAAVEFAFVALPFLALTFAILETALVFFAGQTLEAATADAGRLIMTGQAQAAGFSKQDFKDAVCARIYGLFDCQGGVYVNVQDYGSGSSGFSSATTGVSSSPVTSGKLDTSKMGFSCGGAGDIIVVTLYYQWPIYVSLLSNNLANLDGNNRLLVATSVFRNEPFTGGACS
jgi:Flp pilus assembly protein TadG